MALEGGIIFILIFVEDRTGGHIQPCEQSLKKEQEGDGDSSHPILL